jgi:hypothetical protein
MSRRTGSGKATRRYNRVTPTEYEKAVLERFRTLFPPPRFDVKHNIKILGKKSRKRRQIDIGVFKVGESKPFLIAEAKRHRRVIDIGKAGATIALRQDVGNIPTVIVAASRFSIAAANHLAAEEIETLVITLNEAEGLRWIRALEQQFAVDRQFREISGHFVEAIRRGNLKPFLDNALPYEEWLAIIAVGQAFFPKSTCRVLKALARKHPDDGVRFNAIMLLDDAGELSRKDAEALLSREDDPETLELLHELIAHWAD